MSRILAAGTLLVLALWPSAGSAQDASRDEAIFGAEEEEGPALNPGEPAGPDQPTGPVSPSPVGTPAPAETAREETGRDAAVLSGPGVTGAEAAARLREAYDTLAIGGLLYLRGEWYALSEGDPEEFTLRTPNLLDVYLDARPSDRVRAYVRGRLYFDPTVQEDEVGDFGVPLERTQALLDQAWLKLDVERTLFLTVGQQRIKWGAGRFWNPTDFVNRTRLDPLAVLDERTGVALVKLHLPVESVGWNFYAIADLEDASRLSEVGGALRAEVVVADAEIALSAAARKDNPVRVGADVSTALWELDLHGELALQHGLERPFFEGELDAATLSFPEVVRRDDEWIPQAVLGAEVAIRYSDRDSVIVGAEYFFNDAGYPDATVYPLLLAPGLFEAAVPGLDLGGAVFEPFYLGRHYGAAYVVLQAPGSWDDHTFVLTTLGNLSDRSFVARLDWRVLLLQHLRLDAHVAPHFGDEGEFRLGFDLAAPPSLPPGVAPPPSVRVIPPAAEVGVGLAMDL